MTLQSASRHDHAGGPDHHGDERQQGLRRHDHLGRDADPERLITVGGDTLSGLSQAFTSKDVLGTGGSTLVVEGELHGRDGNGGADYTVTLQSAAGTITPAALTITATSDSKIYDGTTTSAASPAVGTLCGTTR